MSEAWSTARALGGRVLRFRASGQPRGRDVEGSAADVLDPCVRGFATTDATTPDIDIHVDFESPVDAPPTDAPSFHHGAVQVGRRAGGWVLVDGSSWISVETAQRPVAIHAHLPQHPVHLGGFVRTTLFMAIVLALREFDFFHAHAALVRDGSTAWLLVGPSGASKSTSAALLVRAGFVGLADDAVFLHSGGRVAPVARAFHLSPDVVHIEELNDHVLGAWGTKLEVDVAKPTAAFIRVDAVIVLVGPGASTEVEVATPTEAMGALLEASALAVVDGAPNVAAQLRALALVASCPALRVRPGQDALTSPSAFRASLEAALTRKRNEPD